MNKYLTLALFFGAIYSGCANTLEKPNVIVEKLAPGFTNLKIEGSLKSKNPQNCVPLGKIDNIISPPDLFIGVAKCLEKEDLKKAGNLFFLARLLGAYDAKRVADKTAGQGIEVIQMETFGKINKDKVIKFQKYVNNPKEKRSILSDVCSHAESIGRPSYHPEYMILHGIKAFHGVQGDGLDPNFNPEKTWRELLNKGCAKGN